MVDILHDIRFTLRSLRRRPAFALTAILTLALAIGVNTGIFTLVNAILLKPMAVSQPDRLVELYTSHEGRLGGTSSYLDIQDLEQDSSSFSALSAHSLLFANLSWQGRSELIIGEFATSNYMDVLGIRPQIGRFFNVEEERSVGNSLVAVIGHRFWQNRFGGNPSALGQNVQLNGKRYMIVGVMPKDFEGTFPGLAPEIWIPVMMADSLDSFGNINTTPSPGTNKIDRRGYRWLWVTGRLKDGVSLSQARAEMDARMAKLTADFPQSNKDMHITLRSTSEVRLNPELDGALTAGSAFLLAAAGIVLVVACTNVAGMFLARSTARRREVAVRLALGTGRTRLIQQLLIESTSIALLGGLLGLGLSIIGNRLLMSVPLPIPITLHFNLEPDWRVFAFTSGISLLAGVLFGLFPAIQATRRDLINDLKGNDVGHGRMIFRNGLVVAQLALSLVLLVGAGLLVRSVNAAADIDLGFAAEKVAVLQLNLGMYGYNDGRSETFFKDLQERIRGLAGVEGLTMADRTPLSLNINTTSLFPTPTPAPDAKPTSFDNTNVDPDFFEAMQIPIVEGRGIDERDSPQTPRVGVISQAMARQLWPGQSAIGKQMRGQSGRIIEIVGVSRDYKVRTVGEAPRPMIHFARRQAPQPASGILIRTSGPATRILPSIREQVAALDPDVVPFQLTTLAEETSHTLFPVRAGAFLLAALGAFTVFLAGVGLYGLIAYSVSRRTREIGTRIALGATPSGIVKQVLAEGGRLLAVGAAVGLAGAVIVGRLMQSLLYGISSVDWLAFAAGTMLLAVIALLANIIPALAASRVDPIRALKMD